MNETVMQRFKFDMISSSYFCMTFALHLGVRGPGIRDIIIDISTNIGFEGM